MKSFQTTVLLLDILDAVIPPPPSENDKGLPKDFQDALSIIFDGGESTAVTEPAPANNGDEIQHVVMQDDTQMDMSPLHSQVEYQQNEDQYSLLYGDQPTVETQKIDLATQSIPTPPIHMIDAAGNLVMLDADGNRIDPSIENYAIATPVDGNIGDGVHERNQHELDDLAMLGIDADDLAAQCI